MNSTHREPWWRRDIAQERAAYLHGEGPKPEPDRRAAPVHLGEGKFVPGLYGGDLDDEDRGLHVELKGTVAAGGRPVCLSVQMWRLDGEPLTRGELDDLPLDDWAADVASETAFVIAPGESVGQLPPSRGEIADVRASFPQSRWRVTDERLRQVAEIYRAANDRGERPTLAVAQALGYSREYASRLVMRARDAGHLGPAQKGKAGEYQERPVKRRRKKRGQK